MTNFKTFHKVQYTALSQGGTSGTYYETTINVSLSGYTMLCIAGYNANQIGVYPYSLVADYANNTVKVGIRQTDGASLSQAAFFVHVLYYKN